MCHLWIFYWIPVKGINADVKCANSTSCLFHKKVVCSSNSLLPLLLDLLHCIFHIWHMDKRPVTHGLLTVWLTTLPMLAGFYVSSLGTWFEMCDYPDIMVYERLKKRESESESERERERNCIHLAFSFCLDVPVLEPNHHAVGKFRAHGKTIHCCSFQ